MISLVIRARNEERWLGRCLFAVSRQRRAINDVIVVDNDSTDGTRAIAESFGAGIIPISRDEFTFGRALNKGIAATSNEIVLILSAHCIPADEMWADYLAVHLDGSAGHKSCGAYGRQDPLPGTSDIDARDLWTTFREERRVQEKDFFFHNANSAIRKSLWHEIPFNEKINGVEDRAWAKQLISAGFQIVYEPNARAYHHHGIHHGRNEDRAKRVVESILYIRDNG